jgi:hypothetical protein
MISFERFRRSPNAFTRLVGLSPKQFDEVLTELEDAWREAERERLSARERINKIGAGNRYKLDVSGMLLMTLIYLRHYLTMEFLGVLFDLDRANVCRNINRILPLLEQLLPSPGRSKSLQAVADAISKDHPRTSRGRIRDVAGLLEAFPELGTIIVDASEQERGQPKPRAKQPNGKKPVGRPKDKRRYYSKKKGRHTLKTQLGVGLNGVIIHQSPSVPGRMHDAALLKRSRLMRNIPEHVEAFGDKGYEGMAKVYARHHFVTPTKKPKGGRLTVEERETNRLISKVRIIAENALSRVRKFRVTREFYRGRDERHGLYWGVVGGLVNLRRIDALAAGVL